MRRQHCAVMRWALVFALVARCHAGAAPEPAEGNTAVHAAASGAAHFFAFCKAAPGNPPVMTRNAMKAIAGVEHGLNADGRFVVNTVTEPQLVHNDSMAARLRSYCRELTSEDRLFVYWHVHGVPKGLLLDFDQPPVRPWMWPEIASAILALPARDVVVLAMSCYSGQLVREIDGRKAAFAERTGQGRTLFVMASCGADEKSGPATDPTLGNTFACAVTEALEGRADGNAEASAPDGKITIGEFIAYVQARTLSLSANQSGPVFTGSYQPNFVLKTLSPRPAGLERPQ